jgi:hypothetical protein
MLNGPVFNNSPPVPSGGSNPTIGISSTAAPIPNPAEASSSGGANPIDNIANMFSNFFSNNAGNIGEKIAQIGTSFTNRVQTANKTQAGAPKPAPQAPKINKKKLFSDD